jgi:GntR family transcriptional regulator
VLLRKENIGLSPSSVREMRPIDHHSPVPYYYQLADILREEIENGRWGIDELIPAEGALTEIFGISRSVTRKALDLLEGEGRVLRIKGKGTVVTKSKFSYEAVDAAGRWFSQRSEAVRLGQILSAGRVPVGGHLGKLLGLSPREDVWEINLTHTLDEVPVSLSEMYLPIKGTLTVSAPPEFKNGGPDILQQLATRYGIEISDSQLEIDVARASRREAEILGIAEGSPVIQISSLDTGTIGRVVSFTRTIVTTDHFFFAVHMHRKTGAAQASNLSRLVAKSAD